MYMEGINMETTITIQIGENSREFDSFDKTITFSKTLDKFIKVNMEEINNKVKIFFNQWDDRKEIIKENGV